MSAVPAGAAACAASASTALSHVVYFDCCGDHRELPSFPARRSAYRTYVATGYAFPVAAVNNGDRAGLNWGNGGGLRAAVAHAFPDRVPLTFSGTHTNNQVIVHTLHDNHPDPADPPLTLTDALYDGTA